MQNSVIWLLAPDIFHENIDRLKNQIIDQGHKYVELEKYNLWMNEHRDIINNIKGPVIFYGPIQSSQVILNHYIGLLPGAYCNIKEFDCTFYYPRLWQYLLNQNGEFLPFGLLEKRKDDLYNKYGRADTIFIRPNGGDKKFAGQLLYKETFEKNLDLLDFDNTPEDIVFISEPLVIHEEYRIVISNRHGNPIITGSMYKLNGETKQENEDSIPIEVINFVCEVNFRYDAPDPVYVMDIAITSEGPRIIEINSFSCSGLYKCNIEKIVRRVSEIVNIDYQDKNEVPF